MEHDEVFDYLITDEAILDFGNYLCLRNKESHLKNMIKTKVRQLGKITHEKD